jgi:hypothetical protein
VQITGEFLTHRFFDTRCQRKGLGNSMDNYKDSIWYKIERFFDRHNHLMEFIRTILALMVLCLQFYILSQL